MDYAIVYAVSTLISLLSFRFLISVGQVQRGSAITFAVFFPVINTIAAFVFICVGGFMLLYWISNGTLD